MSRSANGPADPHTRDLCAALGTFGLALLIIGGIRLILNHAPFWAQVIIISTIAFGVGGMSMIWPAWLRRRHER